VPADVPGRTATFCVAFRSDFEYSDHWQGAGDRTGS
jgi:hypothetical protein